MRKRTSTNTREELAARAASTGAQACGLPRFRRMTRPVNQSRNGMPPNRFRDGIRDDKPMSAPAYDNSVRIGYARVPARAQDHQAQMDALAAAGCREIITETASTRNGHPELLRVLAMLRPGGTLVIYKPGRSARSVKELLVLLEGELRPRGISLHILPGICAGLHRPDGATSAGTMLFRVAAMAAEMERDLIRERALDGLRAAQAQGRAGGRPRAATAEMLDIARPPPARRIGDRHRPPPRRRPVHPPPGAAEPGRRVSACRDAAGTALRQGNSHPPSQPLRPPTAHRLTRPSLAPTAVPNPEEPGHRRRAHPALQRSRHPPVPGDLLPPRPRRRPAALRRRHRQLPRPTSTITPVCPW